jgi:hypothetical protein
LDDGLSLPFRELLTIRQAYGPAGKESAKAPGIRIVNKRKEFGEVLSNKEFSI